VRGRKAYGATAKEEFRAATLKAFQREEREEKRESGGRGERGRGYGATAKEERRAATPRSRYSNLHVAR
jgi:hypothetical protein